MGGDHQFMGGTVWKGPPRGQCMDGDSMGGNDNSIMGGYVLYYNGWKQLWEGFVCMGTREQYGESHGQSQLITHAKHVAAMTEEVY